MGERLDSLGESARMGGRLVLDSSSGVIQGAMIAGWPLVMLGLSVYVAVALVRIPRMILRGDNV